MIKRRLVHRHSTTATTSHPTLRPHHHAALWPCRGALRPCHAARRTSVVQVHGLLRLVLVERSPHTPRVVVRGRWLVFVVAGRGTVRLVVIIRLTKCPWCAVALVAARAVRLDWLARHRSFDFKSIIIKYWLS
jgi:hypothetical protein